MVRQSDEDLKDNVKLFIPSLKRIYKVQEEILLQGIQTGLRPYQEKMIKSILHTLQGMKIGGNTIKELMDDEYHQGKSNECKVKFISPTQGETNKSQVYSRSRV